MIAPGYLVAAAGSAFFIYMTGFYGIALVIVLLAIIMVLIYLKQNMLLYIPGNPNTTQPAPGCPNPMPRIPRVTDIPDNRTYPPWTCN